MSILPGAVFTWEGDANVNRESALWLCTAVGWLGTARLLAFGVDVRLVIRGDRSSR